jgi:hypothetical protein
MCKEDFPLEPKLSEESTPPTLFALLHKLRNLRIVDKEGVTKKLTARYVRLKVKNTQVICEKKESVSN